MCTLKVGDKVKIAGIKAIYTVLDKPWPYGSTALSRNGHYVLTANTRNLVIVRGKTTITPALIAAEKKPTRKAALIYIKYAENAPEEKFNRAFDMIEQLVPYYAIEVFFDRVQCMSQFYSA